MCPDHDQKFYELAETFDNSLFQFSRYIHDVFPTHHQEQDNFLMNHTYQHYH